MVGIFPTELVPCPAHKQKTCMFFIQAINHRYSIIKRGSYYLGGAYIMVKSSLAKVVVESPNRSSPRMSKVDTITIHCMAGNLSVEK